MWGFWRKLLEHPSYDAFWRDQAVDKILATQPLKVPVMLVHSLWDQEDIARRLPQGHAAHLPRAGPGQFHRAAAGHNALTIPAVEKYYHQWTAGERHVAGSGLSRYYDSGE